jgi:peptidoglycan hydrolase CwlO-like protein
MEKMSEQKVLTTSERLEKAGKEFQRLEKKIEALEKKVDTLEGFLKKKHTDMREVFAWYMKRLQEETDGLTIKK